MLNDMLSALSHWLNLSTYYFSPKKENNMEQKLLVLKRTYYNDATFGQLQIEGKDNPVFFTIENPWLENKQFESCIPEGRYSVVPYSSDKFQDVYEIKNVKGRSNILIHVANWQSQLDGCIAVGSSQGYMLQGGELKKAVTSSREALESLKRELSYPTSFQLDITS